MWYILIEFKTDPPTQGYQAVDGNGVTLKLVDMNGKLIPDVGTFEYRVLDATPPRPAWSGPEPVITALTWEPEDV